LAVLVDEFKNKSGEEFLNKSIGSTNPGRVLPAVGAAQITKPVK